MPSTAIADVEYDAEHHQLTIVFVTGRIYRYFDVPAHLVAELEMAASKGVYFNRNIRDRYRYQEITPAR